MYFKFISEGNTSTYELFNITSNRLEFADFVVKFQFVGSFIHCDKGAVSKNQFEAAPFVGLEMIQFIQ